MFYLEMKILNEKKNLKNELNWMKLKLNKKIFKWYEIMIYIFILK